MNWTRDLGPGWIVTAAFIGPGTVTTASVAGASFGHALLWAIVFSVLATLGLQEMSARLGVVTGRGLGEALRTGFSQPWLRIGLVLLVIPALILGEHRLPDGQCGGRRTGPGRPDWPPAPAVVRPELGALASGALVPSLPPGSLLTVVALIGTTVVPYNLFLHASAVGEKWPDTSRPPRRCGAHDATPSCRSP